MFTGSMLPGKTIVVAKGANTTELKSKIATAVATITSLPVYKVQVFEKE